MNFAIRNMTGSEMDFAVEQAAKEGWNPGLEDARIFYGTDPGGFFMAFSDGKPAGCVSAVSYGKNFGFIGFFIVLEEFRGQGCGIQLGQAALARLKTACTVGVDGVLERQKDYERSGFRFAYSNIRYEYEIARSVPEVQEAAILPVTGADSGSILAYDRQCFPSERKAFLEEWLFMENAKAYAWTEDHQLKGYGVIRKCRTGYKIGPLFADHEGIAEKLFLRLCASVRSPGEVFLDIPEANPAGLGLTHALGMRPVFKTARMYLGPAPEIQLQKVFGVTSFELG